MNLPNKLTLSRILIVPCLIFCLLSEKISSDPQWLLINHWLALILFVFASITDAVDGHIARKYNLTSNFGRLMDPLADKLLIVSTFVAFVELRMFPAWLVITILCREFIVTGLRTLGATQHRVIHADWWGKHKTISQMITLITALVYLAVSDTLKILEIDLSIGGDGIHVHGDRLIFILTYTCLFFTLVSGIIYLVKNRDLLHDRD